MLGAVCVYSHFGVSVELNEIRNLTFGPEGDADAAARFGALHRRSLALFVGSGIAITLLIALHSRADAQTLK